MRTHHALEELWRAESEPGAPYRAPGLERLPGAARLYLAHAIADGTPRASAVRLRMHGEIRQGGGWCPFKAEQVIRWRRGFVWRARVKMKGLPVFGSDRWIDGEGAMRWRILGIVPVATASGPDISQAALGRAQIESIWLPSILSSSDVTWHAADSTHAAATVSLRGQAAQIQLTLEPSGGLKSVSMERWGNPDGGAFTLVPFGGTVAEESTFAGYTIPSKMRVGWHFSGDSFEHDGEFFRVTIDDAVFQF